MRAEEGRAHSTAGGRLAPATGTQRKPRNLELRGGRAGMGSARQRLLKEVGITGSASFSSGLPSLGKQCRNGNGHWICSFPVFPRVPLPGHTLLYVS